MWVVSQCGWRQERAERVGGAPEARVGGQPVWPVVGRNARSALGRCADGNVARRASPAGDVLR